LLDFTGGSISVVTLHIPEIHCSSCIWLLENLHRLNDGIVFSRVNFLKKSLLVRFSHDRTSLRSVVSLLSSLGYEPELSLASLHRAPMPDNRRGLYLKIGIAAFAFGNIMLFSLPEYFAASREDLSSRSLFGYINLILALPVALYSSSLFYVSALQSLRKRVINIDVPIALGIAVVFARSAADVLLGLGPGYFDSLTGLVFFLLIGRLFQDKTYDALNFERRFESYFPLAVAIKKNGFETSVPITSIRPGDRIVIRNNEIVPTDAVIMSGSAHIDYSFVTGEAQVIPNQVGDVVHAGGKQVGSSIELEAVKEVSESKFVQLWNDFGGPDRSKTRLLTLSTTVGKYFTLGILIVAAGTAVYWGFNGPGVVLNAVTAVLIVACPCALALAAPFAFGTAMRLFGNRRFYLKNSGVIEALSKVNTIVFDKTGTLTETATASVQFVGSPLNPEEVQALASLAHGSTHPLSQSIYQHLHPPSLRGVTEFIETEGGGIRGTVGEVAVALGSRDFVYGPNGSPDQETDHTRVYVSIGGRRSGWFEFQNRYREGVKDALLKLGSRYRLAVLSGDTQREAGRLESLYPGFSEMRFEQKPADKLEYIRGLQRAGQQVMMIGDGLNDAGALWQSDVAIAVTEQSNAFSPACDAILNGKSFRQLADFMSFTSATVRVVYWSFGLSLLYNFVGLFFAVQGALSPILAAILMPLSSISVVVFSTLMTRVVGRSRGIS
jgi:Cu+-exporting ATPase